MDKKTQRKEFNYPGLFTYEYGNYYVYSEPFSKKGYRFTNAEIKTFQFYSSRFIIPVCLGVIVYFFAKNIIISLVAAVVFYIAMETSFRSKLLKKLMVIDDFKKENPITIISTINERVDRKQLLVPVVLTLALAVIIPVNAVNQYTGSILITNYIASGLTGLVSIFFIICFIRNKK